MNKETIIYDCPTTSTTAIITNYIFTTIFITSDVAFTTVSPLVIWCSSDEQEILSESAK